MSGKSQNMEHLVEVITSEVLRLMDLQGSSKCKICSDGLCHDCSHSMQKLGTVEAMVNEGAVRFGIQHGHAPAPVATLNAMIDHTMLKPDVTHDQIKKLCEEAAKYKFATVCVNSTNVGLAAKLLEGTGVKAIAVVGFPLGASTSKAKAFETIEAVRMGAAEIDMVINIGALKSKDYKTVFEDIKAVVDAAGPSIPVKVILETSQLSQDEKIISCALSKAAGAAFVKTSTGFGGGGATVEDIALMRRIVGPDVGVKASGGVRTYNDAKKMIEAGANRIGASASVEIVTGKESSDKGY